MLDRKAERRVMEAIGEAMQLLEQADRSVNEARGELQGDLLALATRVSRHVRFLREVAELICHEAARERGGPGARVIAFPAEVSAARLLERFAQRDF